MIQRTMVSKEDTSTVNTRLDGIDRRLDRIEHLLLAEQKRKIEDLEKRMKRLEDAIAV
jgi:tetrahydromethanopterin S-methyltransferase subunit G